MTKVEMLAKVKKYKGIGVEITTATGNETNLSSNGQWKICKSYIYRLIFGSAAGK